MKYILAALIIAVGIVAAALILQQNKVSLYEFELKITSDSLSATDLDRLILVPLTQEMSGLGFNNYSYAFSFGAIVQVQFETSSDPIAAQAIIENIWSKLRSSTQVSDASLSFIKSPSIKPNYIFVGAQNPYLFLAQVSKLTSQSTSFFPIELEPTLILKPNTSVDSEEIKQQLTKQKSFTAAQGILEQISKMPFIDKFSFELLSTQVYAQNSNGETGLAVLLKINPSNEITELVKAIDGELIPLSGDSGFCLAPNGQSGSPLALDLREKISELNYITVRNEQIVIGGSGLARENFASQNPKLKCQSNAKLFGQNHEVLSSASNQLMEKTEATVWSHTSQKQKFARLGIIDYDGIRINVVLAKDLEEFHETLPLSRHNSQAFIEIYSSNADKLINEFSSLKTNHPDLTRIELER